MKFEINPSHIIVYDNKPGEGVTLHVNNSSLPLDGDASSFSDAEKKYAWAFKGTAKEGDTVEFTTNDRAMWGVVKDGAVDEIQAGKRVVSVPSSPPRRDDVTPVESGFLSKVFGKKKETTKPKKPTKK